MPLESDWCTVVNIIGLKGPTASKLGVRRLPHQVLAIPCYKPYVCDWAISGGGGLRGRGLALAECLFLVIVCNDCESNDSTTWRGREAF